MVLEVGGYVLSVVGINGAFVCVRGNSGLVCSWGCLFCC